MIACRSCGHIECPGQCVQCAVCRSSSATGERVPPGPAAPPPRQEADLRPANVVHADAQVEQLLEGLLRKLRAGEPLAFSVSYVVPVQPTQHGSMVAIRNMDMVGTVLLMGEVERLRNLLRESEQKMEAALKVKQTMVAGSGSGLH